MNKKIRIRDIASIAEVSIGTVDRVLHQRGKVSDKALQRVNAALKELNYKPNPMARSLKNNKVHSICVLVPDPNKDLYWLPCQQGIVSVIKEYEAFDLDITVAYFDPEAPDTLVHEGEVLIDRFPDAFLFVPLFEQESDILLKKLFNRNIRSATFNSLPKKHVNHHVGQDLHRSGRVGAKLISSFLAADSNIGIIHMDEAFGNAIHMQQKEKGFRSYFEGTEIKANIYTKTLDSDAMGDDLSSFKETYDIDAFFVTNSKAYKVAHTLEVMDKNAFVIGYDLLPRNIDYLESGKIQFLIHQAPRLQASRSLKHLAELLLFGKHTPTKEFLPIEIINSENLMCYL